MIKSLIFWRLVLFFILPPLIIFLIVFIPAYHNVAQIPGTETWIVRDTEPSAFSVIKNIFEVPFELKWYNFCFEDINTTCEAHHLTEPRIIESDYTPNVTLETFHYGISQMQHIERGFRYCTKVNLNEEFSYRWHWQSSFNINETTQNKCVDLRVTPQIKVKISPEGWTLFTKFILVALVWSGLILLFKGIYDFIK